MLKVASGTTSETCLNGKVSENGGRRIFQSITSPVSTFFVTGRDQELRKSEYFLKVFGFALALMCVLSVTFSGAQGVACTTPVFQYAMYNWTPTPYLLFYFFPGEIPAADHALLERLQTLSSEPREAANLTIYRIDVTKQSELARLPAPILRAWEKLNGSDGAEKANQSPVEGSGASSPIATGWALFSPWGLELYVGRLDEELCEAIFSSPARRRLGELFQLGHGAVAIFVPGSQPEANKQAEQALTELQDRSRQLNSANLGIVPPDPSTPNSGFPGGNWDGSSGGSSTPQSSASSAGPISNEVSPGLPAGVGRGEGALPGRGSTDSASGGIGGSTADPASLLMPAEAVANRNIDLAILRVERSDPAEEWLIRFLMKVQPDLEELADKPMVFFCFGRGRVTPPYVGAGITTENLFNELMFLAGDCSCLIKEANPGVDLLMCWDWDSTALAMATKYGAASPALPIPLHYEEVSPADSVGTWTPDESSETSESFTTTFDPAAISPMAAQGVAREDGSGSRSRDLLPANPSSADAPALGVIPFPARDSEADSSDPRARRSGEAPSSNLGEGPTANEGSSGPNSTVGQSEDNAASRPASFAQRQIVVWMMALAAAVVLVLGIGLLTSRRGKYTKD